MRGAQIWWSDLAARNQSPELADVGELFRTKELRVYMLANQLPLLELGREPAPVRGEIDAYCRPDGEKFDQRMIGNMSIFAFSDPNDMLSYTIPPKFADEYMDSRICPRITNIILNVAQPMLPTHHQHHPQRRPADVVVRHGRSRH